MSEPNLFMPTKRLEIPYREDDELCLDLITESESKIFGFSLMALIDMSYPIFPDWQKWHDESGGTVHLHSRHGEMPLSVSDDEQPGMPSNTDGIPIRENEHTLITVGSTVEDGVSRVMWGVISSTFEELRSNTDNISVYHIRTDDPSVAGRYSDYCGPP
jgi:hypothetical protein